MSGGRALRYKRSFLYEEKLKGPDLKEAKHLRVTDYLENASRGTPRN